jgi:hypothetical protein
MPTPVFADRHLHAALDGQGPSVDPPPSGVIDRIRQQIQHDLLDLALVRTNIAEPRVHRAAYRGARALRT